jgi:threonine/homoserine/homoserine lactone efflux protein
MMIELLLELVPMLFIDVLNPVLFALMVVAVGTSRPFANSTALVAGHTLAYFISGIVIALGLNQITDRLANPQRVDFVVELMIGLLLMWAAFSSRDGKASEQKNPERELTPVYCLSYGAVINFIGVPFALPYFAAVDQLLKANLSTQSSLLVLVFYNAAYALPFMLVPIMVAVMGDTSKPILERINKLLVNLVDKFMPVLLFLLGAALTIDALMFFISGSGLW